MNARKTAPFEIVEVTPQTIDYSELPDYLLLITAIKKNLREKLTEDAKGRQKEGVDFSMIKVNYNNFEDKFRLEDCLKEASRGKLKLESANISQPVLFTPNFWVSLFHIFSGMRIMIMEEPAEMRDGFRVYLVYEFGVGMIINKISYVKKSEIFLGKKPLYILAKKKVEVDQTAEIIDQLSAINTAKIAEERLLEIEKKIEIPRRFHSNKSMSEISHDLKGVKVIAINAVNEKLRKRVDEVENTLCSKRIQTVS